MRAAGYAEAQLWTPEERPRGAFYEAQGWSPRRPARSGSRTSRCRSSRTSRRCERCPDLSSARSATRATPSRCSRWASGWPRAATTVALQTWRRWQEPAEAAGHGVPRRAGVPGLPHPRAAARRPTRRPCAPRGRPSRRSRRSGPTSRSPTSSPPRPRSPRSSAACPWRRSSPTCIPWPPPGFPPFSIGARRPRTRAGALGLARVRPAPSRRASSWAAPSTTTRARGSGSAPLPRLPHRRCRGSLTLVATLPHLEYPRALARLAARRRAAAVGAAGRARSRRRPATARSSCSRRRRRRTRRRRCCAPRWPASRGAPVRVLASTNGRDPGSRSPARPTRVLVPWLSYARRCRRATSSCRHGGHGTLARALCSRLRRRGLPGRRRHGRERGAGRLGRPRRPPPAAPARPARAPAGGRAGAGRRAAARPRPGASRPGRRAHDGAGDGGARARGVA